MPSEAGDASRSPAGLPRSALPFGGSEATGSGRSRAAFDSVEALELFRLLVLSRAAEARLVGLADEGRIRQAPTRSLFREAGPVGSAFALRRAQDGTGDVFAPTFRAAGALELFGVDLESFFRAYVAGEVGPTRDTGAELHRVDLAAGLLAPVVPVGLLVEVVGGLTLGAGMLGQDRVGLVCDTDATTSSGAWHEGVVVAAARRSPMVLVVEAEDNPERTRKHSRVVSFTEKAPGYGLGSETVNGGDVLGITAAVRRAVARARSGKGVQLVEVRYGSADPVDVLRSRLVGAGIASEADLEGIEADVREACVTAMERLGAENFPDLPDTLDPVYTSAERIPRRIWAVPASTTGA